ncbi:MAG: ABC transporter ATP-binding protein [Dehalococcoidia bacterium]|jgi:branched-chain amino acid transport system ATP-binding protein|nr:ABC transporter ATP-binding protein [Dehalococcoidia bacterium]PCJ74627.1 MAG: ABC transporter ATP-binding protein [Dehalococcoidia bacterium]RUA29846.1 MAG: ABC transporter ATP-binding protein [Chloroflexota bacterium]|tara:strand:+ start:621 stop:1334 length:714 start_codon:yes stop_codon:yes gene_type:complete
MILELENISVHYGGIIALDNVSLGVGEGEIVALMGPNGAGKSTVLKAIFGLAPVADGRIFWREQPLDAPSHEIVKLGLAFVPQGRRVFTQLTIEENLELGCLYLKDKAEKRRRMEEVMELFPVLFEKRRDKARAMSGGEQQMLAIGRGLMANPTTLLLDEPTLGLAPIIVKEMFAKIVEINETRKTSIMVVEHNIRSILDVASRVYVLDKGKIAHDGTPSTVTDSDILTKVFLGTVE